MRVHIEDSIADDPHVAARGFFETVEHPEIGRRRVAGAPWKFGSDDVGIRRPAPLLGEHNEYVLGEILGLDRDEIERLTRAGVVH
jgi:crotonobetainyl-CoA:carnitine CoA-transferase CaiB-like acyl-CoA transferase